MSFMYVSKDSYNTITVDKSVLTDCKLTLVALNLSNIGVYTHTKKQKLGLTILFFLF